MIHCYQNTLEFLINVLDQISVPIGKLVKINKHTGPNKHTDGKFLYEKYHFSYAKKMCKWSKPANVDKV